MKMKTLDEKAKHTAQNKAWRERNPEAAKASQQRYDAQKLAKRKSDPEALKAYQKYSADYAVAWRKKNPERYKQQVWKRNLKAKYGITPAEYTAMAERQKGLCAICAQASVGKKKYLSVDHCHTTGKVRGLLCDKCNLGIGLIGDTVEQVQRVMDYILTHVGETTNIC